MKSEAAEVRAARAELEGVWASIFGLYAMRPATGALGAEVVGLAWRPRNCWRAMRATSPAPAGP